MKAKKIIETESASLERVGYDTSGKMERSGSFLIADETTEVATSRDERTLIILPIEKAKGKYPWLKDLMFGLVSPDKDEFTKKVAAYKNPGGVFIYVKRGAKITIPLQSCFFMKTQRFVQVLHNVVVLEPDSELHILTGCTTASYVKEGSHIAITETYVRENAFLTYTMIHDWAPQVEVFPRAGIKIDRGGRYISNYVALTVVKKIQSNPVALVGEDAVARFNTIIYARDGSAFDMGARVLLEGKGARGEILSRIVSEKSRVIARGYIEGANVGTKGHMECNGILLDDAASIYAIPELKGAHPDTGLSHEAAVGKIAGEQLNYLMSRGIDEDTAKSLIVRGFLDVKIEGLPPTLQKSIDKMIKKAAMREAI